MNLRMHKKNICQPIKDIKALILLHSMYGKSGYDWFLKIDSNM